jgi:hypothetical protein
VIPPFSSGLRTKPTLVSGTCVAESTSPTGEAASLLPYRRLREPAHHSNLRYCPAQRNTDMLICLCDYVNKRIVYSRPVACLRPDGCVCGRRRKRDACRGSETGIRVDVRRATQRLAEDPDLPCLQGAQEASEWLGTSRRVQGTREPSNASRGVISKQATPKATTRSEVRDHREAFGDLPQRFALLLDRPLFE